MGIAPLEGSLADQCGQRLLEGETSGAAGDRNLLMQVLQGVTPNVLARSVTHHEQFGCRNDTPAEPRNERLRHDGRQRHRYLLPYGVLALRREGIGNA